eukprot:TRINITY_DN3254_c0_g1_i1.p1 TRINITY_DN3254_c0_g1~~TRINITY_DN3254_c0_g1_i1.p1  ORF type:complete len:733 (+),score=209.45 TRINITY_DN3254_c0_g1_i1:91-2289(+)
MGKGGGKKKDLPPWVATLFQKFGVNNPKNQHLVNALLAAVIGTGGIVAFINYRYQKRKALGVGANKSDLVVLNDGKDEKDKKRSKVGVDAVFFKRLAKILRICIPSWKSQEAFSLVVLTILLFSRTILSVMIAEITGTLAQCLVGRNWKKFGNNIIRFFLITIPASAVNSGLKYFTSMLSLRFRYQLSMYINEEYLRGVNFYKACNLGGDSRIDNADQRVTSDIEKFSTAISGLYATICKPVLDVLLLTHKLMDITGWQGPAMMYSYFVVSGIIKKLIMPSFGRLAARESELEGNYRTAHQRLISNAEEIAFYDGSEKERTIINRLFANIFNHSSYVFYLRGLVGVFDGLLVKYWASIIGYAVMASPLILGTKRAGVTDATILTNDYIRNSSYLMGLATAVGQIVLIGNKVTSLAGYTSRVSELMEMVKHLNKVGNEPFELVEEEPSNETTKEQYASTEEQVEFLKQWRERRSKHRAEQLEKEALNKTPKFTRLNTSGSASRTQLGGTIITGDMIKFEHVDIVSPEGKLLVKDLNVEVTPGINVMVTGPNGSGKSSLFRVIGELWPIHSGTLTKPRAEDFLFVPQKPYQVLGTLRDQVIYPHSVEQMRQAGVTDLDLERLLDVVDPTGIIKKQWNWDEVKDWINTFSGGQKQRVAMARLFYHRPLFAILDECTSAVSDEVEGKIYETCKQLGITLFTVSHRPQLKRYHDYILKFEGSQGKWDWIKVHNEENK